MDTVDTLPPPPSGDVWELDVEDAFGEHDIEYWVWSGTRLVPANPEQIATIREREALARLHAWTATEHQRASERARFLRPGRLTMWLLSSPTRIASAITARFRSFAPVPSDSAPNPVEAATASDHSAAERSIP